LNTGWDGESEFVNREERPFAVRSGDTAHVELDGEDCRDAELRVKRRQVMLDSSLSDAERVALVADVVAGTEPIPDAYCSLDTRSISFVSSEILSLEARQSSTEFCNPGRYATWGWNMVRRLERDERVSLRGLVKPEQWETVRARFAVSDSSNPCIYDEDRTDTALDSSWAIARSQGSWTATFWMDGPVVCRGGMDEAVLDVLPDSLTDTPPLALAWEEILSQEPRAVDAVSSPSGRYLLIHADSLVIAPIVRSRLGARVLSVPMTYEERFNMVRWVSRAEAERWSAVIPTLPPPVVVVEPPRQ
jgi:hypothetical protein